MGATIIAWTVLVIVILLILFAYLTAFRNRGKPVEQRTLQRSKGAQLRHASRLPISPNRVKGDGSVIHEFVEASRVESQKAFGIGAPQEIATVYPEAALESRLESRLSDGWTLFSMEPHWYYERQDTSGAMSITRPLAIVGWYLTWLRPETSTDFK